jgi:hypothetical protein
MVVAHWPQKSLSMNILLCNLPTMFFVGWVAVDKAISIVQLTAGAIIIFAIVITPPRRA